MIRELSPRAKDLIVGAGERLSAGIVAGLFRDRGLNGKYVNFSDLVPDGIDGTNPGYHLRIQQRMAEELNDRENEVPVITGFMGHYTSFKMAHEACYNWH